MKINLLLLLFFPFFTQGQIITTVAGIPGIDGYSGDGGQATNAKLGAGATINCIATDYRGNLFIADVYRIRKVDNAGIITTIAGNGVWSGPTDTGDGRPATAVSLYADQNVGADFSGNIYVDGGRSIRKISPSGILSTVITSNNGGNFVGLNGPATAAGYKSGGLNGSSMWVDSAGQIFYRDSCLCIRKIGTDGIVRIVAGRGCQDTSFIDGAADTATGLDGIIAISTDKHGGIYFIGTAQRGGGTTSFGRVVKIDTSHIVHLLAGRGYGSYTPDGAVATSATLSGGMRGIAVDKDGNVYFVENPVFSSGSVSCGLVRKISTTGILTTVAGILDSPGFSGDGGPATAARLGGDVTSICFNPNGDLYINDLYNYCIRVIKRSTLEAADVKPLDMASLTIAPNPTSNGTFTLRCQAKSDEEMEVTVTAMDGRQVLHLRSNTREPVPIRLPNKGIYLVTADLPGQRVTQRVTVE